MAIDYQQVARKIRQVVAEASRNAWRIQEKRDLAQLLLKTQACKGQELQLKIKQAILSDPTLRCAIPLDDRLDATHPMPEMPANVTLIAADGSQVNPDRHAEVLFSLINVGLIVIQPGSGHAPEISTFSDLKYGDELQASSSLPSPELIALGRDLAERQKLSELASKYPLPIVALIDGPLEIWGPKDGVQQAYQHTIRTHLQILGRMQEQLVCLAGLVDKPGANLVVTSLEVAGAPDEEIGNIRKSARLQGVTDRWLFQFLPPGHRSAIFGLQSSSDEYYKDLNALHFFYLNAGNERHTALIRVEVPAWVALDKNQVDLLHAAIITQCRILGDRPYPYILHRAHETALVSLDEKKQVEQMLLYELRQAGVEVGEISNKQGLKNLAGRRKNG